MALVVFGGVGALAVSLGSDSSTGDKNTSSKVQGAVDDVGASDDTSQTAEQDQSTENATQPSAQSTNQSQTTQPSTNTTTATQPATTDASNVPESTQDTSTDTPGPSQPPITRGDSNNDDQLEVIDVVPVPVDTDDNNGGPTIDVNPVRGGSVTR